MSTIVAAIIAFAAGVISAGLGGWFNQRVEQRKHVAQLASTALVDGIAAITESMQCEVVLGAPESYHLPEDEKVHWERRAFETCFEFYSAKARIAAYGNSEANRLLASIERQGGVQGGDAVRQVVAELVLSFRKELGFKKNDICKKDIATVLFGPLEEEQVRKFVGWPRSPLQQPNVEEVQQPNQMSA